MRRSRHNLGGVFETVRSFFESFGKKKTGLPSLPREERPPLHSAFGPPAARPEERPSGKLPLHAAFLPKPQLPARLPERPPLHEVFRPGAPAGPIMEFIAPTMEIFRPPEKPLGPEPPGLFESLMLEKEEELPPLHEAFRPSAAPAELQAPFEEIPFAFIRRPEARPQAETWYLQYPDIAERTGGRTPLWIIQDFGWVMPSYLEMAERLRTWPDLIDIFEEVLGVSELSWWVQMVQESPHMGEVATYQIRDIGNWADPYSRVASFMGIPDVLVEHYGYEREGAEYLWTEVFLPYMKRFTKAMDVLKPRELRGWFELDLDPSEGDLWIVYKETLRGRPR